MNLKIGNKSSLVSATCSLVFLQHHGQRAGKEQTGYRQTRPLQKSALSVFQCWECSNYVISVQWSCDIMLNWDLSEGWQPLLHHHRPQVCFNQFQVRETPLSACYVHGDCQHQSEGDAEVWVKVQQVACVDVVQHLQASIFLYWHSGDSSRYLARELLSIHVAKCFLHVLAAFLKCTSFHGLLHSLPPVN